MTIIHIKCLKDSREWISNPETQTADLQYHAPGSALKLGYRGCASAATSKGAGCEKGNCWQQTNSCGDEVAKTGSNKNSKHDWTCFLGCGMVPLVLYDENNGLEFRTWNLKVPMIQSFILKLPMLGFGGCLLVVTCW